MITLWTSPRKDGSLLRRVLLLHRRVLSSRLSTRRVIDEVIMKHRDRNGTDVQGGDEARNLNERHGLRIVLVGVVTKTSLSSLEGAMCKRSSEINSNLS